MLGDLNIRVYPEDKIENFPDALLGIGSKITIKRALPVVVEDAGSVVIYRTWEQQIGGFLDQSNIKLGEQDNISPSRDVWLKEDTRIVITRVAETEIKEEEKISFDVVRRNDPNMDKGETRVEEAGKDGKKVKTYLLRRENGVEVSRKLIDEKIITEAEDRVVYIGTRVVILGRGNATWYDLISGMTAAHNSLPRYSYVKVTAVNSGKSVVVKIIDRGIYSDAVIDLSADAFEQLAPLGAGVIPVVLSVP